MNPLLKRQEKERRRRKTEFTEPPKQVERGKERERESESYGRQIDR